MIVTCPDCETSFQLDESRVPEKGIRVRCSRCKHAFHLLHPSASQSAAVDAVAAEAVSGETSTPSVTQDLTSPPPPVSARSGEINNEEDAEWEFDHDDRPSDGPPSEFDLGLGSDSASSMSDLEDDSPAAPETEPADAVERDDSDFSSNGNDVSSGLDLASAEQEFDLDESAGLELASEDDHADAATSSAEELDPSSGAADTLESDENAFGSVDDFSSLMEDDDPLAGSDLLDDESTSDSLRDQASPDAGVYSGSSSSVESDDIDDPEHWDFFDDESAGPAKVSNPLTVAPIGRIGSTSFGTEAVSTAAFDEDAGASGSGRGGWMQHAIQSTGRLVGWTVVLVGCALGVVSGLWTTAESFVIGERTTALGSVEAVDMQAHWVDTARAGRLLVVTGGLRNVTDTPATVSGPIEIALLDRLGAPLATQPTALGVELPARQIRELPIEVLGHMRARAVRQLETAVIPVGGLQRFQAVIFEPPSDGMRFEARLAPNGRLSLPMPNAAEEALDEAPDLAAGFEDESMPSEETGVVVDEESWPAGEPDEADTAHEVAAPGYDDPYGADPGAGLDDL